jgi:hypothetical protein
MNEHAPAAQILAALVPHLFPDNFNRRANARPRGRAISWKTPGDFGGAPGSRPGRRRHPQLDPCPR